MQVSILSILTMTVSGILSIGLPIFLMIFFRKKYRAPLLPVLFGAAAFIVAVLIAERLIHTLVFANTALLEHPYLYVLYGIFMAGIFEESVRFLVFQLIKRKSNKEVTSLATPFPSQISEPASSQIPVQATVQIPVQTLPQRPRDVGTALNYGVGHGGAEAIILVGITMISDVVISIMINAGSLDLITRTLDASSDTIITQLSALWETAPAMFLVGGVERIFAIGIQIALSVLVFYAVFGERKRWLYPAAILLHAIIDLPAAMMQAGFVRNIVAVEVSVGLSCVVLIAIAVFTHRCLRNTPDSEGEQITDSEDARITNSEGSRIITDGMSELFDVSVVLDEEPPIDINEEESIEVNDINGEPPIVINRENPSK